MNRLPGLRDGRLRDFQLVMRGPLARALQALNGEGEETRLVGGAVRDLILGLKAEDVDLATTARPDEVIRRAGAAGFKVAATGISHGTVTLIMDGRTIETTTLREDVETDGRHAKVAFGRDFSADALRRDFTINALSLSPDGLVHDPVGGLDDLAAGRVRFIGDADARIREDYLRILRFFRFSARFGEGALDAKGLSAAIRNRLAIAGLSRERVRVETLKLVVAPHAGAVLRTMGESGILEQTVGFAWTARFNSAIAIESARGAAPDALLRLAALAAMIAEDAERLRERLRLSNAETDRVAQAVEALTGLHGIRRRRPRISCASSCSSREGRPRATRSFSPPPISARAPTIGPSRTATVSFPRRERPSFPSAEAISLRAASQRVVGSARFSGPFGGCGSRPASPATRRRSTGWWRPRSRRSPHPRRDNFQSTGRSEWSEV